MKRFVRSILGLMLLMAVSTGAHAGGGPSITIGAGDVTAAVVEANRDPRSSQRAFLKLTLTPKKQAEIAKVTAANIGKKVRVFVDGKRIMEPTVNEAMNSRTISVTVDTPEHARTMARKLLKAH